MPFLIFSYIRNFVPEMSVKRVFLSLNKCFSFSTKTAFIISTADSNVKVVCVIVQGGPGSLKVRNPFLYCVFLCIIHFASFCRISLCLAEFIAAVCLCFFVGIFQNLFHS